MTKMDWLLKLRRINQRESLEKIIDKKYDELSDAELVVFWSAADHRLAELVMNRLYDRVPKRVWQFVI
ncbi:hemolysin expression modulator Hha [Hafnia alvei]|uniref:hemolysin expression modulator Hha n=1 Tax=Hafnia alvei TaxID=569 RepID=UPI001034D139|nr:hemolysin expression modulator Hha [Hafnia alvei]QBJ33335.1 hemolysin expression modulator Hha [Hafnia alvei]TBM15419.1 hemolysin expression modulator Hha [Hafnia alvei]